MKRNIVLSITAIITTALIPLIALSNFSFIVDTRLMRFSLFAVPALFVISAIISLVLLFSEKKDKFVKTVSKTIITILLAFNTVLLALAVVIFKKLAEWYSEIPINTLWNMDFFPYVLVLFAILVAAIVFEAYLVLAFDKLTKQLFRRALILLSIIIFTIGTCLSFFLMFIRFILS